MKTLRGKKLNHSITAHVIDLHDQGYTDDFLPTQNQTIQCIQNSENFAIADLHIKVVDQGFDQLTKTYNYLHTIETLYGTKGLLIADFVCAAPFFAN